MKIQVTQEDINTGCPKNDTHCPIARALYRLLPEVEEISVGNVRVHLDTKYVYLPTTAKEFIKQFDEYGYAKPFEFELEISE